MCGVEVGVGELGREEGKVRFHSEPRLGLLFSHFQNKPNNFTFLSAVPMRVRAILELEAPAGRLEAPERRRG